MGGLRVDGMTVRFGDMTAVDDVDLEVGNEIVAILGPSGCGKSTLLRAIVGLEELAAGTVRFDGVDQARIPLHKRRFGLMFQDGQLFEHLSVARNIGYGPRRMRLSKLVTDGRVAELLDLVGLTAYGDRRPSTLSGGERQRVALARSLAADPRLMLLDEPLSALDRAMRERLAADVRRILRATETPSLLVTHDHEEAFVIADRVAIMRDGKLVQTGAPRDVWANPIDAETALFLGYVKVAVDGELESLASAFPQFVQPIGALAMRSTALRVGEGPLSAVVESIAPTVDALRLAVRLDDGARFEAVTGITERVSVGQRVALEFDPTAVAVLV